MDSFRLQNVKAFQDSGTIDLRPITLIIGQNSSGKSSLLRFPLVLKQTFLDDSEAPLLFYGKSVDYGNFEDVVFGHDINQIMDYELSISSSDLLPYLPSSTIFNDFDRTHEILRDTKRINICFTISYSDSEIRIDNLRLNVDDQKVIDAYRLPPSEENFGIHFFAVPDKGTLVLASSKAFEHMFEKFLMKTVLFEYTRNESLSETSPDRYFDYDYFGSLFRATSLYFNDLAKGINYIGPVRLSAERSYRFKENAVNYVGREGEFAPVILAQDQKSGGKILDDVSKWLSEHLNFKLEVDTSADTFKLMVSDVSKVEDSQDAPPVRNNLIDVGHGLSQLIPILVQVFMDREPSRRTRRKLSNSPILNLIEQPELHLHPAAQAALADLFLAGIQRSGEGDEPKRSYLIETHSEHMMLRLRRRIVEGTLNPNDVAIYYTEKNKDGKSVAVRKLEIEPDGSIPDWPEGLFEEDYREVLELREAMRKKQKGGDSLPW